MERPSPPVDVSDMLCAQALAVVAQALRQAAPGASIEVTFNADDVRRDLLIWAREQGHHAAPAGPARLRIQRSATARRA